MKFSIQEEGKEKQIFFTFKEAAETTGLPSKTILRVLQSGRNKYFRRADKKSFWIQDEEDSPFIQIDGENFFSAEEIQERFGLSRTVFFNQLCKKRTHFLDFHEKSHEVTWSSPLLEKFIDIMKAKKKNEKILENLRERGTRTFCFEFQEKMNSKMEDYQSSF